MSTVKAILGAVLVAAAALAVPSAAHADTTASPARILIIGDSVTQGKVGNYTWRYRLWNTLRADRVAVDFVGPHTGLYDPATSSTDATGYADPNFDQDHAAWWGLMLSNIGARTNVHDLMTAYAPDVVIEDLGINDLGAYGGQTPAQLIDLQHQLVDDVRAVNPHASVILGQLTQTWWLNGTGEPVAAEYNALLPDLAASLDQPDARVIVATRPADYVQGVDTYDPAHPTASGEVKIAGQFADALAQLPLPNEPTPPAPSPYAGAAHLAAAARHHAARLAFTTPAGATQQVVWARDMTQAGRWRVVGHVAAGARVLRVGRLHAGHRYAFRLRAYDGPIASSTTSNRAAVRVR